MFPRNFFIMLNYLFFSFVNRLFSGKHKQQKITVTSEDSLLSAPEPVQPFPQPPIQYGNTLNTIYILKALSIPRLIYAPSTSISCGSNSQMVSRSHFLVLPNLSMFA